VQVAILVTGSKGTVLKLHPTVNVDVVTMKALESMEFASIASEKTALMAPGATLTVLPAGGASAAPVGVVSASTMNVAV
jgi:hypothetical protein